MLQLLEGIRPHPRGRPLSPGFYLAALAASGARAAAFGRVRIAALAASGARAATLGWVRIAALALALTLAPPLLAETPDSDPRAVEIADRVMAALGGRERWEAVAGLAWTFESSMNDTLRPGRRHVWNKHTGWHRVEGRTRQGQLFVVIHRLGSPEGKAWVESQAIEGDSLQKLVRRAASLWTNDSYWLLMPYKLRDPGVRLLHAGVVQENGAFFDKLALSFEKVGETPGDRYWVYVNRSSNRVERWEYLLQGDEPPPDTTTWEGYEESGGLQFPTVHKSGPRTIYTRRVEAMAELPPGAFEPPAK